MTSGEHTMVLLNPAAGGGRAGKRADQVLRRIERRVGPVELYRSEGPLDLEQTGERAYREGFRRFVCVGGDGTLFEVVNGLLRASDTARTCDFRLGVVPAGTGNSFLRDFGICDVDTAIEQLGTNTSRACDVMRVEHDAGVVHCINLVTLGFTSRVGALTDRRYKFLGALGYVAAVLEAMVHLQRHHIRLAVDGADVQNSSGVFWALCNSQYTGGGMRMAPAADPTDGFMDLVHVGNLSRWDMLATLPKIFSGKHVLHPRVAASRARDVVFENMPRTDVVLDGEVRALQLQSVRVQAGAVRLWM